MPFYSLIEVFPQLRQVVKDIVLNLIFSGPKLLSLPLFFGVEFPDMPDFVYKDPPVSHICLCSRSSEVIEDSRSGVLLLLLL